MAGFLGDTFCVAPWTVHLVNPDGTTGLCCINQKLRHDIVTGGPWTDSSVLHDAKKSMLNGSPVHGCEKCYDHEAVQRRSMRQDYNDLFGERLNLRHLRDPRYNETSLFDLSLGTTCNQKCRICGPHYSTGWIRDAKQLTHLEWAHTNFATDGMSDARDLVEIIESMARCANPIHVELKGGEPLYMAPVRALLTAMIEKGIHLNTAELKFITNGTQHDMHLLDLLARFPAVNIGISIDATEAVYEYVRGSNLTWEECVEKWRRLRQLPNVTTLRLCNTIYAYNIFDLRRLRTWAMAELGADTQMADAILHRPSYMQVDVLPRPLLTVAAEMLAADDPIRPYIIRCINSEPHEDKTVDRQRFVEFTRQLDAVRGESCAEVIPQLAPLFA